MFTFFTDVHQGLALNCLPDGRFLARLTHCGDEHRQASRVFLSITSTRILNRGARQVFAV